MAGAAGVIEVNVSDHHGGHIGDTDRIEGCNQVGEHVRWPAFDEDPIRGIEQVAGEPFRFIVHPGIDHVEGVAEIGHLDVKHSVTLVQWPSEPVSHPSGTFGMEDRRDRYAWT